MEENILTTLREEHRELQILMLKIERSIQPDKKISSYQEFKDLLISHMEAEEHALYLQLQTNDESGRFKQILEDSYYEHREIKDLLSMLDEVHTSEEQWNEIFNDLKEELEQHIENEETELFSELQEDFSYMDLAQFAWDYQAARGDSLHG